MAQRYYAPLLTLPASDVDEAPLVCFHFNQNWIEVLLNLVERADKAAAWVAGTDFERAEQEALKLFQLILKADTCEEDSMAVPIGSIQAFAGAAAPSGWLFCRGQAVSRSTYSLLFFVIGDIYGAGDGTTTFNLPDLQDRAPVGLNYDYIGVDPPELGDKIGAATHRLTIDELPPHQHQFTRSTAAGGSTSRTQGTTTSSAGTTTNTAEVGGNLEHNNIPPSLILNFIIYAGE